MPHKDKEKQKAAQHQEYLRNKDKYRERSRRRREKRKIWWLEEVMKGISCHFCSEDEPVCIDWHHRDPSTKGQEVSKLYSDLRSKERVLAEIAKCIPVCSNCHRKLHAGLLTID